jgi:putative DNA primase/helicase
MERLDRNPHAVIKQFKTAMSNAGITPPDTILADGALHRFTIDGKLNGAYVLHATGTRAHGYFQDFKRGIKQNWWLYRKSQPMTKAERRALNAERTRQQAQRRLEEEGKHGRAARKAFAIYHCSQPAPIDHPYLVKKRIQPHGAKLYKGSLVIPLYDIQPKLVNVQFIQPDGTKRFLSGGKKKGCFYLMGKLESARELLICEGFATGSSLHEHTGKTVAVAFDAGNLKAVAEAFKSLVPNIDIIIMGDNDESQVGQTKAHEAALAVKGKYLIPEVVGQDWNDALTLGGSHG